MFWNRVGYGPFNVKTSLHYITYHFSHRIFEIKHLKVPFDEGFVVFEVNATSKITQIINMAGDSKPLNGSVFL